MEQERIQIKKILLATLTSLCSNTLKYKNSLSIEGLIGITIDKDQVLLISINQEVNDSQQTGYSKSPAGSSNPPTLNATINSPVKKTSADDSTESFKQAPKTEVKVVDAEPYSEVLKTVKLVQKADGLVEQLSQVAWKTVDAEGQVVQHKTYETVKTLNNADSVQDTYEEDQAGNEAYAENIEYGNIEFMEEQYAGENEYAYDQTQYVDDEEFDAYEDYAEMDQMYAEPCQNYNIPRQRKPKPNSQDIPKGNKKKRDCAWNSNNPTKRNKTEPVYKNDSQHFRHQTPQSNVSSSNNFSPRASNPIRQNIPRQNNLPRQPPPRHGLDPQMNSSLRQPRSSINSISSQRPADQNMRRISTMLEMAVQLIINKKLTIAKACTLYSLPRNLILKRLKETQT